MKKKISIYPLLEIKQEQKQKEISAFEKQYGTNLENIKGLELCEKLSKLSFWCGNDTIHKEKPDTYQDKWCCLTHVVGLPEHSATKELMPLTPYQVDFFNTIHDIVTFSKENQIKHKIDNEIDWLRKCHLFHINKGRQMGFTEIVLRIIQFYCFSRYAGSNIAIQAGTTGSLAQKDLRRFARLFKSIPLVVSQWVKSKTFKIVNDCVIEAFSANEEAMTGDTKYKCVFQDESAKWRLVDDQPVFNSIMPIVRSNGADLFLVSTPKRPVKMFYEIHKEPKDFIKLKYDIWETEGNLYTKKDIEDMLATSTEDPNQEYLCEFTVGKGSIFGIVTDDDREKGFKGFHYPGDDEDDEDDGYIEDNKNDSEIHEVDNENNNNNDDDDIKIKWGFSD